MRIIKISPVCMILLLHTTTLEASCITRNADVGEQFNTTCPSYGTLIFNNTMELISNGDRMEEYIKKLNKIELNDKNGFLIISKIQKEHKGLYNCLYVKSINGEMSSTCLNLVVNTSEQTITDQKQTGNQASSNERKIFLPNIALGIIYYIKL